MKIKTLEDIKTPSVNGPRRFVWRGKTYAMRTNGFVALLLLGGHDADPLVGAMAEWITTSLGVPVSGHVARSELLAWTTYPPCSACSGTEETNCDRCRGRKAVEHECDCDRCEYDGDEECPDCEGSGKIGCVKCCAASYARGTFRGRSYDRRKVGEVLSLVQLPETLSVLESPEALMFTWDGGALFMMPLRADIGSPSDPVLTVAV